MQKLSEVTKNEIITWPVCREFSCIINLKYKSACFGFHEICQPTQVNWSRWIADPTRRYRRKDPTKTKRGKLWIKFTYHESVTLSSWIIICQFIDLWHRGNPHPIDLYWRVRPGLCQIKERDPLAIYLHWRVCSILCGHGYCWVKEKESSVVGRVEGVFRRNGC